MMVKTLTTLMLCAAIQAIGQTHFSFTPNTGVNAIVGIPAGIAPTVDGTPIALGDEIAAYSPGGLCVGATVWTGSNIALTLWGDNSWTPVVDGIRPGERMVYRMWQKTTATEFSSVIAAYAAGNGVFAGDGVYTLASLTVVPLPPAIPILLSPVNGGTGVSTTPTLQWQPAENATHYSLEVAADSLFAAQVVHADVSGVLHTMPVLLNATTYYWRLMSGNSGGVSAWSAMHRFTTQPATTPLPAAPGLLAPANGDMNVSTTPLLEWRTVATAASYTVEVSFDSLFLSVIYEWSVRPSSKAAPLLSEGTDYYWRVQSMNAAGVSDWSAVFHFTTIIMSPPLRPPAVPLLLHPVNGAVNLAPLVSLQWNRDSTANQYLLHIGLDSLFQEIADMILLADTALTPEPLSSHTTYYWRVRSGNTAGVSRFSPVFSFTVGSSLSAGRSIDGIVNGFGLGRNYPNPFNPSTTIRFSIPFGIHGHMSLRVYDVLGREAAVLVNGPASAGIHTVVWNAAGAASGIYFCRLSAGGRSAAAPMLYVK